MKIGLAALVLLLVCSLGLSAYAQEPVANNEQVIVLDVQGMS